MPMTFYGTGAMRYGRIDRREDKTYVTTTWLTLLFFPLIPVVTQRVRDITRTKYQVVEQLPYAWPQIIRTYLIALLFLCAVVFGIYGFFYGLDLLNARLAKPH